MELCGLSYLTGSIGFLYLLLIINYNVFNADHSSKLEMKIQLDSLEFFNTFE